MNKNRYIKYQQILLEQAKNYTFGPIIKGEELGDNLYLTVDGSVAFVIPESECLLDISKLSSIHSKAFSEDHHSYPSIAETQVRIQESSGRTCVMFLRDDGTRTFVDSKFIRMMKFGRHDMLWYHQESPLGPVSVFSEGVLLGLICPVRLLASELKGIQK